MKQASSTILRVACWTLLLSLPALSHAQTPRTPVVTTPHFVFYSHFDTNLNDALIAAGLARSKGKPELFHSGPETDCFAGLRSSTRAAWDGAVDYYAKIISASEWNARPQFLLRMHLVGFDSDEQDAEAKVFVEIARGFMAAAAPAYRACRWTTQDQVNRRWIEELQPRLAADEQQLADRLQRLYQKKWARLPILVDVVQTVNWSGANTSWSTEGQGNILISPSPGGVAAFEVLFHEASHVLMDRSDPVRKALDSAAAAADVRVPPDLWHLVLFYTTGEAVKSILDAHGPSGYTTMLYEMFATGTWREYRPALEDAWRPYVDGKRSLAQASAALVEAIRKQEQP